MKSINETINCLDKKKIEHINSHNKKNLNRRDLIKFGILSSTACMVKPTSLFAYNNVFASKFNVDNFTPFLVFDLAGGAGLPGTFLVGEKGNAYNELSNYSTLGWNPKSSGIVKDYGAPIAPESVSTLTRGLNQFLTPELRSKCKISTICHTAEDDTNRNKLSSVGLVSQLANNYSFRLLKNLGLRNSESGGNSSLSYPLVSGKTLFVQKCNALEVVLTKEARKLNTDISRAELLKFIPKFFSKGISSLSFENDKELQKMFHSSFNSVETSILDAQNNDARLIANIAQLYGISANTNVENPQAVIASTLLSVISGYSPSGVVTINGCDYHTNNVTDGANKDLEIGQQIARSIAMANFLNKPLFIQVLTDGGVSADSYSRAWSGESGIRGMTVMISFDPEGKVKYKDDNVTQIGGYNQGQIADTNYIFGDNPSLVSEIVFANYLACTGKGDLLDKYISSEILKIRDSVIVYA